MLESFGIPLPGETALIAFGVLAAQGHYSIAVVIAVAAAGAIVGDNLGYWLIGTLGGRALFRRWRWLNGRRPRAAACRVADASGTAARRSSSAASSRSCASPWRGSPGLARMTWWRFLFWNAAGGIAWATARRARRVLRRQGGRRRDRSATGSSPPVAHRRARRRLARACTSARSSSKNVFEPIERRSRRMCASDPRPHPLILPSQSSREERS